MTRIVERARGRIRRSLVPLALAAFLAGGVSGSLIVGTAEAHPSTVATAPGSTTTDSPWVFQMDNAVGTPQVGLRIRCNGGVNGQCLQIDDELNQPILAVNKAGGAWVLGDNLGIIKGGGLVQWSTTSQYDPDPTRCGGPDAASEANSMWFVGTSGNIWKCIPAWGGWVALF